MPWFFSVLIEKYKSELNVLGILVIEIASLLKYSIHLNANKDLTPNLMLCYLYIAAFCQLWILNNTKKYNESVSTWMLKHDWQDDTLVVGFVLQRRAKIIQMP